MYFFTSPNHWAEYVPSLVLYPSEISIPDNYVVSNPNTYCSKISVCIELFFSTETPPPKMFETNHQKSLPSQRNIFLSTNIEKKCLLKDRLLSHKKNTVHRRRGVWRILMNYIQPNAGQTTHSIYTLIQDGAQYVPLKCRKARREFYWTKKKRGVTEVF